MCFDSSIGTKRHLFHFPDEFLELDMLVMDRVLRHMMQEMPQNADILLYLPDTSAKSIAYVIEQNEGVITGDGLGKAVYTLLADGATVSFKCRRQDS